MWKRMLALLMIFTLLLTVLPAALAEDADEEESELSEEELAAIIELDDVEEDNGVIQTKGPVLEEPTLSDFNASSPAIYTARMLSNSSAYVEKSITSKKAIRAGENGCSVEVLYVGTFWAIVRRSGDIGYVKRQFITDVTPLDRVNTAPYGVQKHAWIARTSDVAEVRVSMTTEDDCWVVLQPGTLLSIYTIVDGWAVVNYWRQYGYIEMSDLTDLIPVSPTDDPINDDSPIAAYTSYYNMAQSQTNLNRIENIRVACERLTGVRVPGEEYNCNKQMGPYKKSVGYLPAPVLVDGTTKNNYGGGTCQVSSTLYNALLQLPGIEILQRRPHGPAGAKYLPHGVDAAVGNDNLNLRFRNNYDFPVRIEGHSSGDGALCMLIYRVSE